MTNISPIPQVDGLLDFPVGGHVKDQIPANRRQEGSSESEEEEEVPERVQRGRGGARVRARGRGGVAWLGVSGRGSGRVIGRGRCGGRGGARRVARRPGEPGGSSPWRGGKVKPHAVTWGEARGRGEKNLGRVEAGRSSVCRVAG